MRTNKLKKLNIAIDPTVSIFEDMFTGEAGEPTPSYKDIIHRLPLDKQRFFKSGSSALETPEGLEETYKNSLFGENSNP